LVGLVGLVCFAVDASVSPGACGALEASSRLVHNGTYTVLMNSP
jgi:hypothetical protein